MRSLVTSKNVSWPRLIWPTLYIQICSAVDYTETTVKCTNMGFVADSESDDDNEDMMMMMMMMMTTT